jgi:hypothetical protein
VSGDPLTPFLFAFEYPLLHDELISGGHMKPEKILSVLAIYEHRLCAEGIPKRRMNPSRTFESLNKEEILAHAHYLIDGAKELAIDPERQRRAGSHLSSIQVCLSFAGWYTLQELMDHNKP